MIYEVQVAAAVYDEIHRRFGSGRTSEGSPSEYDFVSGPLAAAVFAFRDFESMPFDIGPAVRSYTVPDPIFGPVVFIAVLLADGVVEIADFSDDPDYWDMVQEDPT